MLWVMAPARAPQARAENRFSVNRPAFLRSRLVVSALRFSVRSPHPRDEQPKPSGDACEEFVHGPGDSGTRDLTAFDAGTAMDAPVRGWRPLRRPSRCRHRRGTSFGYRAPTRGPCSRQSQAFAPSASSTSVSATVTAIGVTVIVALAPASSLRSSPTHMAFGAAQSSVPGTVSVTSASTLGATVTSQPWLLPCVRRRAPVTLAPVTSEECTGHRLVTQVGDVFAEVKLQGERGRAVVALGNILEPRRQRRHRLHVFDRAGRLSVREFHSRWVAERKRQGLFAIRRINPQAPEC